MSDAVHLEDVRAAVKGDRLEVCYRVGNRGEDRVFVADRLFVNVAGGRRLAPSRAYRWLEGDTLVVLRGAPQVPDDVDVEVPEVPYLTSVAGGGAHRSCFELALPVEGLHPYRATAAGEVTAERVQLVVGWVRGVDAKEVDVGGEGAWWAFPSSALRQQVLLRATPVEVRVPTRMMARKR